MEKVKNFWARLPAHRKKQVVLGVGCGLLVTVLWQFLSGNEFERKEVVTPSSVRLTGDNTDRLAMDAVNARIRSMERANNDLRRQIDALEASRREAGQNGATESGATELHADYQRQIDRLHERLNRQIRALNERGIQIDDEGNIEAAEDEAVAGDEDLAQTITLLDGDTSSATPIDFSSMPQRGARPAEPRNIWSDQGRFQAPPHRSTGSGAPEEEGTDASRRQSVSMQLIESTPGEGSSSQGDEESDVEPGQFLPAGSIISGTLITGLDAPTSNSSRRNPHPALVRIKTESILPNRYRADLRECFMIVSGYGDMSSERAYLRTETLSCINHEGKAMETRLESFAVGEDGKAGVRGRLVTKTGQLLAKSTMAAFIGAASDVFGSSPIPTISTTATDTMPFQQALSREATQSAAMRGTGKAMERIADYYMNMADQIFPILEVDAGREIDLILNSGATIRFDR